MCCGLTYCNIYACSNAVRGSRERVRPLNRPKSVLAFTLVAKGQRTAYGCGPGEKGSCIASAFLNPYTASSTNDYTFLHLSIDHHPFVSPHKLHLHTLNVGKLMNHSDIPALG